MKKLTLITLILVLVMTFFAGCRNSDNNTDNGSSRNGTSSGGQAGSDITGSGSQMPGNTGASTSETLISETEAREKALKHAGFKADEVTRLRTEYDFDDGIHKYEIEFYKDNIEYDYEVNAVTGDILSFDKDRDFD